MRTEPNWRIPVGIIGLTIGLIIYGVVLARYLPGLIGAWNPIFQTIIYLALGLLWLLPLGRFLIWMETGRWSKPAPEEPDT